MRSFVLRGTLAALCGLTLLQCKKEKEKHGYEYVSISDENTEALRVLDKAIADLSRRILSIQSDPSIAAELTELSEKLKIAMTNEDTVVLIKEWDRANRSFPSAKRFTLSEEFQALIEKVAGQNLAYFSALGGSSQNDSDAPSSDSDAPSSDSDSLAGAFTESALPRPNGSFSFDVTLITCEEECLPLLYLDTLAALNLTALYDSAAIVGPAAGTFLSSEAYGNIKNACLKQGAGSCAFAAVGIQMGNWLTSIFGSNPSYADLNAVLKTMAHIKALSLISKSASAYIKGCAAKRLEMCGPGPGAKK